MSKVAISEDQSIKKYPSGRYGYSPSSVYPEYPWTDHIAKEENKVYDLVRECIHNMGYDVERYGTPEWNPFGDFIQQGQTVLIKPNWVQNKNSNKKINDQLNCLVTNPSVVRVVVDYVAIALKGNGRIIIADAPMQMCNLDEVFRIAGYNELFTFYKKQGLIFEVADLRKYHVEEVAHHVFSETKATENSEGIKVDIGNLSLHAEKDKSNPQYKVSEYELSHTASYHHETNHTYEINKLPLEADVIINVPKPKTHRLAGMTAACKNIVGVICEKACLPHRIIGDKQHGGDAYLKKSFWKELMQKCDEKKTNSSNKGRYTASKIWFFLQKATYVLGALTSGDKYRIGSWYGNDTIWRTTVDLNYIMLYADKKGVLQNKQQRTIVTIGDLIIAGQGEGPVGPCPKPLGLTMMANNNLLFDRIMCEIMGFDHRKFQILHHPTSLNRMGYSGFEELNSEQVYFEKWMRVSDFKEKTDWHFKAHSCWEGYIEK